MMFLWLLLGISIGFLAGPVFIVCLDEKLTLPSGWWALPGFGFSVCFWLMVLT